MASKEMSTWIAFFKQAGIPPGPALSYATLFVDNRMQINMLMDLNKEYLRDMGITVLGDIIAILKYAKTAHAAFEREKPAMEAMSLKANEKVELKRHMTAGNRMLEHYMRKEGIIETQAPPKVAVSPAMAVRLGAVPKMGTGATKTKPQQPAAELVPVKRVRKVDPAEEGHYVISMPKGTTARTKTLLQKKQQMTAAKSNVFQRLGKEVGGGGVKTTPAAGGQDVFSRLGGVQAQRKRSLSDSSQKSICEYQGVLKEPTKKPATEKTLTVKIPSAFMDKFPGLQRPEVSTTTVTSKQGVLRGTKGVKGRLGPKLSTTPTKTNSPVRGPIIRQRVGQAQVGAQTPKVGVQNPKVTVTLSGLKRGPQSVSMVEPSGLQTTRLQPSRLQPTQTPPSGIQKRLGPKSRAERFSSPSVFNKTGKVVKPKAKQPVLVTLKSDKPKQKVTMKERLGTFKTEASSTTPTFTITTKNVQKVTPITQRVGTPRSAGSKSVFSRLGKT